MKNHLRIARPTDNLSAISKMYRDGLSFDLLGSFESTTGGFDGVMLGHPDLAYHLEFTHHHGVTVGQAPTQEHLLVFYIPDRDEWAKRCETMRLAGFKQVSAYNPYWDKQGMSFEDVDGYRVVLQSSDVPCL